MKKDFSNKLIPLSELSIGTPHSAEYLSLLARRGKLSARKVDNVWHATQEALDAYLLKQSARASVADTKAELLPLSKLSIGTPYSTEYLSLLARKGKLSARKIDNVWHATKADLEVYRKKVSLVPVAESLPVKKLFLHNVRRASEEIILKLPEVKGIVPRSFTTYAEILAALPELPTRKSVSVKMLAGATLGLLLLVGGSFLSWGPLGSSATQVAASSLFGTLSGSVEFVLDGFRNLHHLVFGISYPKIANVPISLPVAITEQTSPIDPNSFKTDLKRELELYIESKLAQIAYPEPRITYTTGPITNTTVLREEILLADTRPHVSRQSTSDIDQNSRAIARILDGGTFVNSNISSANITNSVFEGSFGNFTNVIFNRATGTSATTTNFATENLCLNGDCRTTFPSGSAGWPFTKLGTNEQATSTTLAFLNGFLSTASSTLTEFTFANATGTNATSTNIYVSGLASTTELRANTALFGGNVGIGTTTPGAKLSVKASAASLGQAFLVTDSADVDRFSILDNGTVLAGSTASGRGQVYISGNSVNGQYSANSSGTLHLNLSGYQAGHTQYRDTNIADGKGSTVLFVKGSSASVGIGTTTPYAKLAITGIVTDTNPALFAVASTTGGTATTTHFTVLNNGNVGVGTINPTQKLEVNGTALMSGSQSLSFNSTTRYINANGTRLIFATDDSAERIALQTNASERLSILSNGNIGVGTTTPSHQLTIASSTGPQLTLTDATAGSVPFTFRQIGSVLYIATSSQTSFATSSTPQLTIDGTTGHMGIATSSTASARLTIDLNNHLTTISRGVEVYNAGDLTNHCNTGDSTDTCGHLVINNAIASGAGYSPAINILGSGTSRARITAFGQVFATTNLGGISGVGSQQQPGFSFTGEGDTGMFNPAANSVGFTTNSIERMRIDANGLVGIATSTPSYQLSVSGSAFFDGGTIRSSALVATSSILTNVATTTNLYATNFLALGSTTLQAVFSPSATATNLYATNLLLSGSTTLQALTAASSTIARFLASTATTTDFFVSNLASTSALRANTALFGGRVGINNLSPAQILSLGGNLGLSNGSTIISDADNGNSFKPYEVATGRMVFQTAAQDRLSIIYTTGNVGVGTTSPSSKLSITGSDSGSTLLSVDAISGFSGPLFDLKVASTTKFSVNQAGDMYVNGSSTLQKTFISFASTTVLQSSSDAFFASGGGRVSIGSTTAMGQLSIEMNTTANPFVISDLGTSSPIFMVSGAGNVGVGTAIPSVKLQAGLEVIDDNSFSYDSNSLMVVHQTPTASATLNDPKTTLMLARQGTSGQAFGAAATFNLSRYENVSTNSRTRLDISLAHTTFDPTDNIVMTMLSSGNVGVGSSTPFAPLSVQASSTAPGVVFRQATSSNSGEVFSAISGTSDGFEVANLRGLNIKQIATLSDARLASSEGVAIQGRYAYMLSGSVSGTNRVNVIDVSNPRYPVIIGSVQDGTRLAGAEDLFVAGDYVYVTTESSTYLTIVDVSNPSAPYIIGSVSDAVALNNTEDVFVSGRYAYVTSDVFDTLTVVDVSDATAPFVVSSITGGALNGAEGVHVIGDYAYIASEDFQGLAVVDISNPTAPFVVGSVSSASLLQMASGIYVSGRYAYVSATLASDRLVIIDVSNPASPTIVSSVSDPSFDNPDYIYVAGNYAYLTSAVADSVLIVSVASSTAPKVVGKITSATLDDPIGFTVSGRYAYVGNLSGTGALSIFDIGGLEIQNLQAGEVRTGTLRTEEGGQIGTNLLVGGSIESGKGIFAAGPSAFSNFATTSLASVPTLSVHVSDSNNSSVVDVLSISHTASSSAADNIGTGLLFQAEDISGLATSTSRIASILTSTSTSNPLARLTFYTKNTSGSLTERMTIGPSGNIGISTTSPQNALHIENANAQVFTFDTDGTISNTRPGWIFGSQTGSFIIATSTDYNGITSLLTDRVKFLIDANGRIGVGTSTPQWRMQIMSTSSPQLALSDGGALSSNHWTFRNSGGILYMGTSSPTSFASSTNGVFTIDGTTGFVGIATSTPLAQLHLESTIARILSFDNDGAISNARPAWVFGAQGASFVIATSSDYMNSFILGDSRVRFSISQTGNVGIGGVSNAPQQLSVAGSIGFQGIANGAGTAYICTTLATSVISTSTTACNPSSLRYKDNVENLSYGLSEVMNLRSVAYDYKPELLVPGHQIGFIAEEMYEVIPEVVGLNEEGEPNNIDYSKLTSLLVKAIQDIVHITGVFKHSLVTWLGDTTNGIQDFFANRVRTKELCISDSNGETCISKSQLDTLLAGANMSGIQTTSGGGTSDIGPIEIIPPSDDSASSTPETVEDGDPPETVSEPPNEAPTETPPDPEPPAEVVATSE